MADGIAAEGMKLIARWLPRAVEGGSDLDARGHMLVAASMGATAFQKGLGGMHALSHPIGALLGTHHGLTNAVLMPYLLAFNRPAVEERLARLAGYIGLADASFDGFLAWIVELRQRLGIPHRRSEEHTSELQSRLHLVCRLLLEKKKNKRTYNRHIPA